MGDLIKLFWQLRKSKTGGFAMVTLVFAFMNDNVGIVSQYLSEAGFSVVLTVMALITAVLRMFTTESLEDK